MTPSEAPGPGPSKAARVWIRLVVSPILLLAVLGILWLHDRTGNPLPSDLLLLLLGAAGALEFARMAERAGRPCHPALAAACSAALAGVGLLWPDGPALRFEARAVFLALAVVLVLLAHFRDTRPAASDAIALTLVPVLWVGFLLSFVREAGDGADGARTLAWIVLTAKASDMGGWLVGKTLGRHRLIPSVSPKKTWEGLAGGLLGSVLAGVLLPAPLHLEAAGWSLAHRALFGLALGAAATLAGILHSAWKRRLGAKDSSVLIPEMGGVLDMLDSILLAGPVAWAWLRLAGGL